MKGIGTPKQPSDGQRNIVVTWTILRLLTNHMSRHGALGINDGPLPGPTKLRPDDPRAVRTLAAIKHQEGRTNPYIPKHFQKRQRPIDDRVRLDLELQSWYGNVKNNWSRASSYSSTNWWQSQEWHEPQERREWEGQQRWRES